jgi:hypothetical protein
MFCGFYDLGRLNEYFYGIHTLLCIVFVVAICPVSSVILFRYCLLSWAAWMCLAVLPLFLVCITCCVPVVFVPLLISLLYDITCLFYFVPLLYLFYQFVCVCYYFVLTELMWLSMETSGRLAWTVMNLKMEGISRLAEELVGFQGCRTM